jgi:hypothetical protein
MIVASGVALRVVSRGWTDAVDTGMLVGKTPDALSGRGVLRV